jgi:hypothetical protein
MSETPERRQHRFVENLPFLHRFSVTSKLIRALNSVQASTIQQVEAFR